MTGFEEIVERINALAERHRETAEQLRSKAWNPPKGFHAVQELTLPSGHIFELKKRNHISDFLVLPTSDFVFAAYHVVLKREPDEEGRKFYAELLDSREMERMDFLQRLLESEEGRLHSARIPGLSIRQRFNAACELPVVGQALVWLKRRMR